MTITQYYTATTLDGYIADEHHSLDWLFQFGDGPEGDYPEFIANTGALIMGSHTYEWLLRNHIAPEGKPPQPWPYTQPTWIMTTRELPRIDAPGLRFARGDIRAVYDEMHKVADGKNIWVMGGGELVGQFYDAGLLDEIIATVAPVTLGAGAPLLPRRIVTPPMRFVDVKQQGPYAQLTLRVERPE